MNGLTAWSVLNIHAIKKAPRKRGLGIMPRRVCAGLICVLTGLVCRSLRCCTLGLFRLRRRSLFRRRSGCCLLDHFLGEFPGRIGRRCRRRCCGNFSRSCRGRRCRCLGSRCRRRLGRSGCSGFLRGRGLFSRSSRYGFWSGCRGFKFGGLGRRCCGILRRWGRSRRRRLNCRSSRSQDCVQALYLRLGGFFQLRHKHERCGLGQNNGNDRAHHE